MNTLELTRKIKSESGSLSGVYWRWFIENEIEPVKVSIFSDLDEKEKTEVWVITKKEGNSYRIYYDTEEEMYGLTVILKGGSECIMGLYGTLEETIHNM
jgi:hypothetical protein